MTKKTTSKVYADPFEYTADDYLDNAYQGPEESDFDDCCGAGILHNFAEVVSYDNYVEMFDDRYNDYKEDSKYNKEKPRKASPDSKKAFERSFAKSFANSLEFNMNLIQVAILAQYQEGWFPVLEQAGFKLVSDTFVNPGSSNRLFVFVYTPKNKRK